MLAVVIVLLLIAVFYFVRHDYFRAGADHAAMSDGNASNKNNGEAEREVLYWYDPMVPQHRFDKPGKSPFMDMQLVPRYADEGSDAGGMQIDPAMVQQLGMREAEVLSRPLAGSLTMNGRVSFNSRLLMQLQSPAPAFVERVWPLAEGDLVAAGEPLVALRVPEWLSAQHELLALRAAGESTLLAAARQRLRSLGMPQAEIDALEKSGEARERYRLSAPQAGVLETLHVSPGMTLSRGAPIARLQQLSSLWVEAAVPQALVGQVQPGAAVTLHISGINTAIKAQIDQLLPLLDSSTGAMTARIEVDNPAQQLRPGMTVQIQLQSASQGNQLLVPTEAIVRTGKRTLVMRAEGAGRFTPVEVAIGAEAGNQTVIEAGLQAGQRVVVSGQFLLDSEASLRGIEVLPLADDDSGARP